MTPRLAWLLVVLFLTALASFGARAQDWRVLATDTLDDPFIVAPLPDGAVLWEIEVERTESVCELQQYPTLVCTVGAVIRYPAGVRTGGEPLYAVVTEWVAPQTCNIESDCVLAPSPVTVYARPLYAEGPASSASQPDEVDGQTAGPLIVFGAIGAFALFAGFGSARWMV